MLGILFETFLKLSEAFPRNLDFKRKFLKHSKVFDVSCNKLSRLYIWQKTGLNNTRELDSGILKFVSHLLY